MNYEDRLISEARVAEPTFLNWFWGLLAPMAMHRAAWDFARITGQQLKVVGIYARSVPMGIVAGVVWWLVFSSLPNSVSWPIAVSALVISLGVPYILAVRALFRLSHCRIHVIERNDRRRREWCVTAVGEGFVPRLPFLHRPEVFVGVGEKSGVNDGDIRVELALGQSIDDLRYLSSIYSAPADTYGFQPEGAVVLYDHYHMHSLSGQLVTLSVEKELADTLRRNWGLLVLGGAFLFLIVSMMMPGFIGGGAPPSEAAAMLSSAATS